MRNYKILISILLLFNLATAQNHVLPDSLYQAANNAMLNEQFSDETATSMNVDEGIVYMLLEKDRFQSFIPHKTVADTATNCIERYWGVIGGHWIGAHFVALRYSRCPKFEGAPISP